MSFFFVRFIVFEVWSILYMGAFAYMSSGTMHNNRPYTKSTMSQKLKVAQEKLMNLKIIVKAIRIFPVNLITFKKLLFWSVAHLLCHRKL